MLSHDIYASGCQFHLCELNVNRMGIKITLLSSERLKLIIERKGIDAVKKLYGKKKY